MDRKLFDDLRNTTQLVNAGEQFDNFLIHNKSSDKCNLALKLLIELIRLQKNPEWLAKVDANVLSSYVIHMCKFIKNISSGDVQKFLTVIGHVHRFFISKKVPIDTCNQVSKYVLGNPHIIIKTEHSKVYWAIFVDKISLLQNCDTPLNTEHFSELVENALKCSEMVGILPFCTEYLPWIVKNFFFFNGKCPQQLKTTYEKLFNSLSKSQIPLKKTVSTEVLIKKVFKCSLLSLIYIYQNIVSCDCDCVKSYLAMLNFYISLFKVHPGCLHHFKCLSALVPTLTTKLEKMCSNYFNFINEIVEKIKQANRNYENELKVFSPIFGKILNICISRWLEVTDERWKNNMSIEAQILIMRLIFLIMKTLNGSNEQHVTCKNCSFQSGIHDSYQLTGLARSFIVNSANHKMDIAQLIVPYRDIFEEQIESIRMLFSNGCTNWKLFWSKIESDHHKDAILLYSLGFYEESVKYFEAHTIYYMRAYSWDNTVCDLDHLSRVFFNMAICQMDFQKYAEALRSCYISMAIVAAKELPESDEKHARFAFQIKAKVFLLASETDDHADVKRMSDQCHKTEIHKLTVWSVIKEFLAEDNAMYRGIFSSLDFGELLLTELNLYSKSWPSTVVMAGICESLRELCEDKIPADDLNNKDPLDMAIVAGKAVTILNMHSHKLNKELHSEFIKSTIRMLERALEVTPICDQEPIVKILLANCDRASYQCELLEKRKLGSQLIVNADIRSAPQESRRSAVHPDDACDVEPTHQYLSLSVEESIVEPLLKAVCLWKEAIVMKEVHSQKYFYKNKFETYIEKTLDIIDVTTQTLALHGLDFHALIAADVAYAYATLINDRIGILNSTGFLIENSKSKQSSLLPLIDRCNGIVQDFLSREESTEDFSMMNAVFEYLLNLSIYYFDYDVKEKGIVILVSVSNRMMQRYLSDGELSKQKVDDLNFSFAKLIVVKALYNESKNSLESLEDRPSTLASFVNAHVECSELIKIAPRGRYFPSGVRMWIESGMQAARASLSLGLPRVARALLRSLLSTTQRLLLPRRVATVLSLLATIDLACEQLADCRVKLEGIRYITDEQQNAHRSTTRLTSDSTRCTSGIAGDMKLSPCTEKDDLKITSEFETLLDIPAEERLSASLGSPIFLPRPFSVPSSLNHKRNCQCCKCTSVIILTIFLEAIRIEASLHFMSGNRFVAGTFYDGGFRVIKLIHSRRRYLYENNKQNFLNKCSGNILEKLNNKIIANAECRFLIDATLLFISDNNIAKADAYNLKVFETMREHSINDRFIEQFTNEQKLFLMHLRAFKSHSFDRLGTGDVDNLGKDFSTKLMLTPEKRSDTHRYEFKTPCNNRTRIQVKKQLNSNIAGGSSMKREKPEFLRPPVKLKFNQDDHGDNNPAASDTVVSDTFILKTPLPKSRSRKQTLLEDSAKSTAVNPSARTRDSLAFKSQTVTQSVGKRSSAVRIEKCTSENKVPDVKDDSGLFATSLTSASKLKVYQNKSRLIRSTSPGKLEEKSSSTVVEQKVKCAIEPKIRSASKANLSPDVDLVKKYSIRKRK